MYVKSCWKITWDAAGTPLVLLNWGDWIPKEIELSFAQTVQREPVLQAAFQPIIPRGNLTRDLSVARLEAYGTPHELRASVLACDAAAAALQGICKTLDISIVNLSTGAAYVTYRTATAAILTHTAPIDQNSGTRLLRTWTLAVGAFTLLT